MNNICGAKPFDLIEKYKKLLVKATNIETSPEEMSVIDNILLRFWQVGWLDKLEKPENSIFDDGTLAVTVSREEVEKVKRVIVSDDHHWCKVFYQDAKPKRGKWVPHPTEREWDTCSICGIGTKRREYGLTRDGGEWVTEWSYQYCPNCGVPMESEE